MHDTDSGYTQDDLEKDFNEFLSTNIDPITDDLKEITDLRNMETTLHDLGSYVATIIQQILISGQSKYKLIHDKSLDLALKELLENNPEQKDIIYKMQSYKQKIDDIIHKTSKVFGIAMETWD